VEGWELSDMEGYGGYEAKRYEFDSKSGWGAAAATGLATEGSCHPPHPQTHAPVSRGFGELRGCFRSFDMEQPPC
jgi:hypothetical protein